MSDDALSRPGAAHCRHWAWPGSPWSAGPGRRPGPAAAGEPEDRQPREVDCGGEEREVGTDLEPAPDPCPSPAVAAADQVGELAFDLGPGRPVVGEPGGVATRGAALR